MPIPQIKLTRRQSLSLLGGLMASTAIALPQRARAQTGGTISPPKMRSAIQNIEQRNDYRAKLKKFTGTFAERYPHQEMAPVSGEPDELYVLNCTTRQDIPLNSPTGTTTTYFAPAYVDGYVDASIVELPPRPTVGPTITLRRGAKTGVMLHNDIEVCGDAAENLQYSDDNAASGHTPHGFQVTNLHTHGLHVSPNAPSDDVLVTVDSTVPLTGTNRGHHKAIQNAIIAGDDGTYFPYFYDLRADHPVGTFWYHPHKHGAVASQVAPGMAGALIVRENGDGDADFDSFLAGHGITEADEEIIVLQTLKGQKATKAGDTGPIGVFFPQAYYDTYAAVPSGDCYGLTVTSTALKIPTTVNGVVNPTITMEKGQIKRLRIVNAASGAAFVPNIATHDSLEIYAIAIDGIALKPSADDASFMDDPFYKIEPYIDPASAASHYWTTAEILTLAPGQRLDLLVKVKDTASLGKVQIADAGVQSGQTNVDRAQTPPNVIETSSSEAGNLWNFEIVAPSGTPRLQSLPTKREFLSANISRPPSPFDVVTEKDIQTQELVFRSAQLDPAPAGTARNPGFTINGQNFDPNLDSPPQIVLGLDQITNWTLYSSNDAHIFHIHINSFQVIARETPTKASRIYQMPIWRDTVYFDGMSEKDATRVIMSSYQVDYTGEYVLHCHNLFHEDSGMMLSVAVE